MARHRVRAVPLVLALGGLAVAGTACGVPAAGQAGRHDLLRARPTARYHAGHRERPQDVRARGDVLVRRGAPARPALRDGDAPSRRQDARPRPRAGGVAARERRPLPRRPHGAREAHAAGSREERWGKRDLKVLQDLYDEYVRRFPKDPEGYSDAGRLPREQRAHARERSPSTSSVLTVNPNYALAYNTLGYYKSPIRGEREGRGLPEALPVPRVGPGEPVRFARRVLRARRPVRRGRGDAEARRSRSRPTSSPSGATSGRSRSGRGDPRAAAVISAGAPRPPTPPRCGRSSSGSRPSFSRTGGSRDEALAQFERMPVPKPSGAADPEEAEARRRRATRSRRRSFSRGSDGPTSPRRSSPPSSLLVAPKAGEKEPAEEALRTGLRGDPGR